MNNPLPAPLPDHRAPKSTLPSENASGAENSSNFPPGWPGGESRLVATALDFPPSCRTTTDFGTSAFSEISVAVKAITPESFMLGALNKS